MATTKATTLAHTLGGISSDISTAEINRLDGVTGDLQTQLDAKAPLASPSFTGDVTLGSTTKLKLGSSGGIYESDGSTSVLTESSGLASLSNSRVGSSNTFPAGHITQVVQSVKTDAETGSSTSWTDVGSLSATITPSSSSNKIMVMIDVHSSGVDEAVLFWRFVRNGSAVITNSSSGGAVDGAMWSYYARTTNFSSASYQGMRQTFNYLDSPSSTSALTYKVQVAANNSSYGWRCNRGDSLSSGSRVTSVSSVTLMEIVG